MTERGYVGIDVGTQGARVLISSAAGHVLGSGRAPLTSIRSGNRHEQDPESWWTAVCAAARAATRGLPAVELRAGAVCATSGTIVRVEARNQPAGPALMYDDGRAGAEAELLNNLGADEWTRFGYMRMQPTWALPRILWMRRHTGWTATTRVLHQSDFVNQQLVGHEVPTDVSNALKSGCDAARERWPDKLLGDVGIAAETLPNLVRPGQRIGSVSAEAADSTGLPTGMPILAGTTDGCAAQLASGAIMPGTWNSVLGTTLALKGVADSPLSDPDGVVYSHRSPDGRWLPGGASGSGAGAIASALGSVNHDALAEEIARRRPSDLVVYPLASKKGERFPFVAPSAHGFVLGEPRDDADLYTGILQGIALIERLCFDYLDLLGADTSDAVHLTGSAAGNRWLAQVRADVLGRRTIVPAITEPAFGMAVLAAAQDEGNLVDAAERMVRFDRVNEPAGAPVWAEKSYLELVGELERRGWLPFRTASHARDRSQG